MKSIKLKEVVVIAMLSSLLAIVFTAMDGMYASLGALLGPLGGDFLRGIYLISALIAIFIVRKPGTAIMGSLFTGIVNLLLGSPYGIHIIVAALLQGFGIEAVLVLGKYKKYNFAILSLAAIAGMMAVTLRDYFIFGMSAYTNLIPYMLIARAISSSVLGAGLTIILVNGAKKTGVLSGFNVAKKG